MCLVVRKPLSLLSLASSFFRFLSPSESRGSTSACVCSTSNLQRWFMINLVMVNLRSKESERRKSRLAGGGRQQPGRQHKQRALPNEGIQLKALAQAHFRKQHQQQPPAQHEAAASARSLLALALPGQGKAAGCLKVLGLRAALLFANFKLTIHFIELPKSPFSSPSPSNEHTHTHAQAQAQARPP